MRNDYEELNNLSEKEREAVLKILGEYSKDGDSKSYKDLITSDYDEVPVDIEEFLHNPKYLGRGLINADGKFTVFPYWEKKLKEIFPNNLDTAYNTLVLTGAIGLGKTLVACICLLYILYRLLCLKDPYLYYGLQPIDKITISLMNITLENAKGVALDKVNQLLLSSEWFLAHGKMSGTANLKYTPEKHIELITASSNNQVVGRCLDGETRVITTSGPVAIKELVGKHFQVVSIDDAGNHAISDYCTAQPTATETTEYEIELEDGSIIRCTPNHKFLLKDLTYKEAKDLSEEDELFDTNITYEEFINGIISTRGQWNIPENEYFEVHHIIPKCVGGEGEIYSGRKRQKHPNLIFLYAREHFIAHKLLAKENSKNKSLVFAWSMMAFPKGKTKRNFEITPQEYEELRKFQSDILKVDNPFLKDGKPWNKGKKVPLSEENLKNIRLAAQRRKGIKLSEDVKKNMSAAQKLRYKEHPESFIGPIRGKVSITNGEITKYICKGDRIPEGFYLGQKPRDHYNIKDRAKYTKQKSEQTSGKNNPMYGKGYKLSGGKNGKAIYIYTYNGIDYLCRDDLMVVLQEEFPEISESTIRRIMSGKYTIRISKKYQKVIDNLTWRLKKDEN